MHRVMRRGALVADCVVLWLRFAEAADLDRYCACCRANAASFRDLRLAIAGVGPAPPRDAELRVVCDAPRVGVLAQFLSPLERRWLVALGRAAATSPVRARLRARKLRAKHYVNLDERAFWLPDASRALLRRVGQRVEALTRCPRTADDGFELHYTPAGHDASDAPASPAAAGSTLDAAVWHCAEAGLHVDNNNGFPHRYCTALAYVNDVEPERGGATVFPCARRDAGAAAPGAAARLLGRSVFHTDTAVNQDADEALFDDATDLLARGSRLCLGDVAAELAGSTVAELGGPKIAAFGPRGAGLRVQPRAGALCVFWSLDGARGDVDAASWHGGAKVLRRAAPRGFWDDGKWTLQAFKQVPADARRPGMEEARRRFIRESRTTESGMGGGLRFDVVERRPPPPRRKERTRERRRLSS